MASTDQALKEVAAMNAKITERKAFIEQASVLLLQGILAGPSGATVQPIAASQRAVEFASALADTLKKKN